MDTCRSFRIRSVCRKERKPMEKARVLSCSLEPIKQKGIPTNPVELECLVRQCGDVKDLSFGRYLHAHIIESGLQQNGFLANLLLQMYGKCQAINDARGLIAIMQHRDVYTWTFMIGAYAQLGQSKAALCIFQFMQRDGVKPNIHTFIYLLSACANKSALVEGRHVHTFILSSRFEQDAVVATALVCMYSKCGSVDDAWHVFDKTCEKDTVSWNAIISMFAEHGHDKEALQLFQQMQVQGLIPTKATFLSVLSACMDQPVLPRVKRIHSLNVSCGFHVDIAIVNALVTIYGKCGSIKDAHIAFQRMPVQNVISWTAMIAAYAELGQSREVVQLLQQMQYEGVRPDKITFASSLSSCVNEGSLLDGKWIHSCISHCGFEVDVVVGTALINMYGKCGSVESAHRVFEKLSKRDVVCWNAMIAVYAQHGHGKEALELLQEMKVVDLIPSKITFISILDACANKAVLDEGRRIHACLMRCEFESEIVVVNALVNMYGKCGSLADSQRLFDKMLGRNVVSWTAIIAAYGQQGRGKEALHLFEKMRMEGIMANEVTFVSILSACSHSGMVEEAWYCFLSMEQEYNITSTAEQYDCMVDLLGRAGLLSQGQALISNMPFQPNATTWMAFLGACKMHSNTRQAAYSAVHILEADPDTAAPFVLLSNIYSAISSEDGAEYEDIMTDKDLKQQWDCSLIEALSGTHTCANTE